MSGRINPNMEYRFGAFADIGPEAESAAYFATAEEAIAYARGMWAGLDEEARRGTDVYAGEINIHRVHYPWGMGTAWDSVKVLYDAKDEERRASA